ncbi:DUF6049 family protein [Microbacterium sp. Root180]|uniref:DUF6049 family protein n=1 Tax=Microbacterium sp. Root180 TaxID=1736483 RepID=UPI0006F9D7FF|nr:DUF6049 family protein [Microbacterium sp. Root180]KRB36988.1 hypothetical protein ASD93_13320 [Microbacterium sp. Root180]
MTLIPAGTPARRRASRAVAVVLAILTALATPGIPAFAGTPSPIPTPTPPIPAGTTAFTLAPISNGIVSPGEALAVSLTLQNETDAATAAAVATVSLGRTPLPDRESLSAWLEGTTSGVRTEEVATASMESVPARSQAVTAARVEADDPSLAGLAPGVYPLLAAYDSPTGTVTSTSAVIVPEADPGEIGLGVLVPITAGPLSAGLLTADELGELTAPDGALTAQLDGVEGTAAILAIDPAIPAAVRVLGSSAPESATAWLARLEALPNSRFALQFGDADIAAQLETGLTAPLRPTSLTAYMVPENFVPDSDTEPTPTPTPTPGADPDAPVLPTLAELLEVGPNTREGVYWPTAGSAGPAAVEQLGGLTVDDQGSLTVIPSATTTAGAGGQTVRAHGVAGDASVLVYDSDISAALEKASALDDNSLRGAALTQATAYLAFATAQTDGAPLLVTLGRNPDRSRLGLAATIGAALDAPGVTPFTIGGLANSATADVEIEDAPEQSARSAAASALLVEEAELARFSTILDDTSLLTGPERAEVLQLLGNAWLVDDVAWTEAVSAHRDQTATTLDSVGLVPTAPISLFGSNVGLRFWVRNDLPYPVNLVLYVTPDDLRLDVQRANPLIAQPSSNTRVEVPVQARVGNGDVTLDLQLRSRASVAIGDPESVEVSVRAEWETFGLAALGIVVGALLLFGVVRTVRRIRARRRGKDAAPGDADAGTESEDAT